MTKQISLSLVVTISGVVLEYLNIIPEYTSLIITICAVVFVLSHIILTCVNKIISKQSENNSIVIEHIGNLINSINNQKDSFETFTKNLENSINEKLSIAMYQVETQGRALCDELSKNTESNNNLINSLNKYSLEQSEIVKSFAKLTEEVQTSIYSFIKGHESLIERFKTEIHLLLDKEIGLLTENNEAQIKSICYSIDSTGIKMDSLKSSLETTVKEVTNSLIMSGNGQKKLIELVAEKLQNVSDNILIANEETSKIIIRINDFSDKIQEYSTQVSISNEKQDSSTKELTFAISNIKEIISSFYNNNKKIITDIECRMNEFLEQSSDTINSCNEEYIGNLKSSIDTLSDSLNSGINNLSTSLNNKISLLDCSIQAICESLTEFKEQSKLIDKSDKELLDKINRLCK